MAYIVGARFEIGYTGTLVEVNVLDAPCVSYDGDDGGALQFTATSVGAGTIHVQTSDGSYHHDVSVICDYHTDKFVKTVPPKCEEQGYTLYKCSICETETKTDFVDALGHRLGEPYEDNGSWWRACSRCGLIQALGGGETPDPGESGEGEDADAPVRVFFPAGYNAVRLTPMYQWDFGRKLEIHTGGAAGKVEVHFMCHEMVEPLAYACTVQDGVVTVPIPDGCLEHSSDIKVWIYKRGECCGRTAKEITIPIIARTRPPRFVEDLSGDNV